MTEVETLNLLQSEGIISDNCVWLADVAKDDLIRAEEFLLTQA